MNYFLLSIGTEREKQIRLRSFYSDHSRYLFILLLYPKAKLSKRLVSIFTLYHLSSWQYQAVPVKEGVGLLSSSPAAYDKSDTFDPVEVILNTGHFHQSGSMNMNMNMI